jgi:glutamate--cysteine ligase
MDRPVKTLDDLLEIFHAACKPTQLIGVESEKFGVTTAGGRPVPYDDPECGCGIVQVFERLRAEHGWQPLSEKQGGPIIALERIGAGGRVAQITLEPGAQLELSGEAVASVHDVEQEIVAHLGEIAPISQACGVSWLGVGYHPLARQADLPWVPKDRYAVMREYFPKKGTRGLDMMRRTATEQVNLDFAGETDAMRKLALGLKLAPVVAAMFANSPFAEGRATGNRCERAGVWLDADPDRTGLLPQLWRAGATFRDYAEWALDVPMYLFKREGTVFANTGQTFRSFWQDGFQGERPTTGDWKTHLATLFPEARIKQTLEVRSVDSQPLRHFCALPALWAGLFYDERATAAVEELMRPFAYADVERARADVWRRGMAAELGATPVRALAERIVDEAQGGLGRRARRDAGGQDETRHLASLVALVSAGRAPADRLLENLEPEPAPAALVERTRADG